MKFKTPELADEFDLLVKGEPPLEADKTSKLIAYLVELERLSILLGFDQLTITSLIRKGNPHSLHFYGRAADIRIHDKPREWYEAMTTIGQAIFELNPQFRMNPHTELLGTPDEHLHIEIREKK